MPRCLAVFLVVVLATAAGLAAVQQPPPAFPREGATKSSRTSGSSSGTSNCRKGSGRRCTRTPTISSASRSLRRSSGQRGRRRHRRADVQNGRRPLHTEGPDALRGRANGSSAPRHRDGAQAPRARPRADGLELSPGLSAGGREEDSRERPRDSLGRDAREQPPHRDTRPPYDS